MSKTREKTLRSQCLCLYFWKFRVYQVFSGIFFHRSETDGKWEYYSLECLLYFLKNIRRTHADYVRQAKGEVPIVHRPDRRDLIAYLQGSIEKKDLKSIDHSAPLQMSTNFKRSAESTMDSGPAQRPRLDNDQFRERLSAKLDAPAPGRLSINKANLK